MTQQTVNTYFERFENAKTIFDKHNVANEFRTYYEGLNATDKVNARTAMQPLLDKIKESFQELDNAVAQQKDGVRNVA